MRARLGRMLRLSGAPAQSRMCGAERSDAQTCDHLNDVGRLSGLSRDLTYAYFTINPLEGGGFRAYAQHVETGRRAKPVVRSTLFSKLNRDTFRLAD